MSRVRFCAILDSGYLARGLVLHQSLRDVARDVALSVVCMEPNARVLLGRIDLEGVDVLDIGELEEYDPALVEVRPTRTLAEYCWTAKPSLCRLLFDLHPEAETVVYVDADQMFFADPALILAELDGGSVLVVPHRAPPEQDWEDALGTFNAGFLAFRRSEEALAVLGRWREQCLEWCHARIEPGRYCDQKYLDEWPGRFPGTRVLGHVGGGLAPWNVARHSLSRRDGAVYIDGVVPLVFFHYQSLELYGGRVARLARLGRMPARYHSIAGGAPLAWSVWTSYDVTREAEELVYAPYAQRLAAAGGRLAALGEPLDRTFTDLGAARIVLASALTLVPGRVRAALRRVRSLPERVPRPSRLRS